MLYKFQGENAMTIFKNQYPILEYDDSEKSIILPNHENLELDLPKKCLFTFLADALDKFANDCNAHIIGTFNSISKIYPIYIINYKGEEICLVQAPVGAEAFAQ